MLPAGLSWAFRGTNRKLILQSQAARTSLGDMRGIDLATVLLARQLFTPLEAIDDAVLVMEDGVISAVGARADVRIPANARVWTSVMRCWLPG